MPPYEKPYLTPAEQLALLESRGMQVSDRPKAITYLERIGYYRLSAYWYPCRASKTISLRDDSCKEVKDDLFKPGTEFSQIVDLYVFDKRLRLLMLDALERIEIALRTHLVLALGKHDTLAHRDSKYLHKNLNVNLWKECLKRINRKEAESKEDFIKHFREKYPSSKPPLWIAVELWDFGALSHMLSFLTDSDKDEIASRYGIPRRSIFISWARTLAHVRNICAHHARLWNKPLVNQPEVPRQPEMPEFSHWYEDRNLQTRFYAAAAITRYMVRIINPTSSWPIRLKSLIDSFPASPNIELSSSGFPEGWGELPLWN
jgi:abortive infection bacteriophage resistance protein